MKGHRTVHRVHAGASLQEAILVAWAECDHRTPRGALTGNEALR